MSKPMRRVNYALGVFALAGIPLGIYDAVSSSVTLGLAAAAVALATALLAADNLRSGGHRPLRFLRRTE